MESTSLPEQARRADWEIRKLSEALLLCQRELAQVREQQEQWEEQSAEARKESLVAQKTSTFLSQALAGQLSRAFWEERQPTVRISWRRFIGSRWPWLRKRFGGRHAQAELAEQEQVRLVEASEWFQADWYLRNNADVALAGINPAVHYLQAGAQEGRDPGPEFRTEAYLEQHPELEQDGINPLVHFLQSGQP